jgi:hypothetical protein
VTVANAVNQRVASQRRRTLRRVPRVGESVEGARFLQSRAHPSRRPGRRGVEGGGQRSVPAISVASTATQEHRRDPRPSDASAKLPRGSADVLAREVLPRGGGPTRRAHPGIPCRAHTALAPLTAGARPFGAPAGGTREWCVDLIREAPPRAGRPAASGVPAAVLRPGGVPGVQGRQRPGQETRHRVTGERGGCSAASPGRHLLRCPAQDSLDDPSSCPMGHRQPGPALLG